MGGSQYGRYEIIHKLGAGAMATVYLAKDPMLHRFVAVKVLHPDLAGRKPVLQRFFNEAKTVARVRNPHVVEVFDFGREGREPFLVMEFIDGQSLAAVLKQLSARAGRARRSQGASEEVERPEPMDAAVTAAIIGQAAEGLGIAAACGVVHRDVKPENLMINQQGYLKIADFGIAHLQDDSITKTGAILGSPLYMSPEQVRGAKPITGQSDMWSLGAVFYCCLAGRPPFHATTLNELYRRIATAEHEPLTGVRPDLDPSLTGLVEVLLRKDPRARGDGPAWLQRELRRLLMAGGIYDPPDLVRAYLRDLTTQGIQTTWQLDESTREIIRTVKATARPDSGRVFDDPALTEPATETGPAFTGETRSRAGTWAAVIGASILAGAALGAFAYWRASGGEAVAWPGASNSEQPLAAARTASRAASEPVQESRLAQNQGDRDRPSADPRTSPGLYSFGTQASENVIAARRASESPAYSSEVVQSPEAIPPEPSPGRVADPEAFLDIASAPPFAEVFLDGHRMGVTPLRLPVLPGTRRTLLLKDRHGIRVDTTVTVGTGTQVLRFQLEEEVAAGE